MARRAAGLTAAKVKTAKPGRYGDGGGLYLLVRSAELKFWLFRFVDPHAPRVDKKTGKAKLSKKGRPLPWLREMGLGPAAGPSAVSLAEARDAAAKQRQLLRAGINPLDAKKAAKTATPQERVTFAKAAKLYIAAHEDSWRNDKHRAQWKMTLDVYAAPHFGALPVSDIRTEHVSAALTPIWSSKTETASRLRGRIESVLDFARVQGWREGENPARWKGHLSNIFPKRSRVQPVEHHAALPWQAMGEFMVKLRGIDGVTARALEFVILTATRTTETLGARWREIDLVEAVWTIPAERMKGKREHRVALSSAALDVLEGMLPLKADGDSYVFPGARKGAPLSQMTLLMLLRRTFAKSADGKQQGITTHGFRSTFRDWAGETTAHAREVVERALSHGVGDKVEEAYARGDLFQKRRALMEDWADFCGRKGATVDSLRGRALVAR